LKLMDGAAARYFSAMSTEHLPCDETAHMAVVPFEAAVDFAPASRSEVGRCWPPRRHCEKHAARAAYAIADPGTTLTATSVPADAPVFSGLKYCKRASARGHHEGTYRCCNIDGWLFPRLRADVPAGNSG
jgi:hypothetical protein